MSDKIREVNQFEKKMLLQGMETISKSLKNYIQEKQDQLLILLPKRDSSLQYPQIFYVSKKLANEMKKLQGKTKIKEVGIYMGFIKRGEFHLSIEGAEFFNKKQLLTEYDKLYVKEQGAKAILYGNNITKEMVESFPKQLAKNQIYFIFNPFKELIAVGLSLLDQKKVGKVKDKEEIVINLIDKGYYLREKQ